MYKYYEIYEKNSGQAETQEIENIRKGEKERQKRGDKKKENQRKKKIKM